MQLESITEEDTLVIRRLILAPGEHTVWHADACRRFTVVVRGERLGIEYQDGERIEFEVHAGMSGWDDPEARVHRATNLGNSAYEEVVSFYRSGSGVDPQPAAGSV